MYRQKRELGHLNGNKRLSSKHHFYNILFIRLKEENKYAIEIRRLLVILTMGAINAYLVYSLVHRLDKVHSTAYLRLFKL